MNSPPTQYAKSGDVSIAYQVVGDGPIDLVLVLGFTTHLELQWESPPMARFFERLSSFSRLMIFDKRGSGLSDPVTEAPTLEQRIDDVRAVMDAAGSERAALFGISEGAPMSVLFAATHPERVSALVLHGAMGRTTEAPDYPWASPAEALRESAAEFIAPCWGQQAEGMVELFAPSFAGDPEASGVHRPFRALRRQPGDGPADLRDVPGHRCASHPAHDPGSDARHPPARGPGGQSARREELASQIPGARYVELPGIDHLPWAGDAEAVLGEIEEFLTGARSVPEPDRVLATVMFTDIVGSTERAAEVGDARWRELLAAHQAAVRRELERFGGREVKTLGDGYLATFDGPARAIRCGRAIAEAARSPRPGGAHRPALRRGRADGRGRRRHRGPHRGPHRSAGRRRAKCSSPAPSRISSPDRGSQFADRGATAAQGNPRRMAAVRGGSVANSVCLSRSSESSLSRPLPTGSRAVSVEEVEQGYLAIEGDEDRGARAPPRQGHLPDRQTRQRATTDRGRGRGRRRAVPRPCGR